MRLYYILYIMYIIGVSYTHKTFPPKQTGLEASCKKNVDRKRVELWVLYARP